MSNPHDRHGRDDRERAALLAGEELDRFERGARESRPVVPAGYAADGVCTGRCPANADDAPDTFVDAALAAIQEWRDRNGPLAKREVNELRSRFAREPGLPAVRDDSDGPRCVHIREIDAAELGAWTADADVALVDLDDTVRFADFHAVPVDEDGTEYVPLVVAADGFFGEVARDFHRHYHALQRARDRLDARGAILTDGGGSTDGVALDDETVAALRKAVGAIEADRPPALELAERLADTLELSVSIAQDRVEAALDAGLLVEEDVGVFGGVRLAGGIAESDESADTDEQRGEGAGSGDSNPTLDAEGSGSEAGEGSKYRRIYLEAAERAGRNTWEFVEEAAIREALDAAGFAQLLDRGDLFHIGGWRVVDTSDDGEDSSRRWYYPSENEPRADEFRRFHDLLIEAAPDDYQPFYFRVEKAGKAPATQYGSWKTDDARLSVEEAVEWMEQGGNVGIAGTPDDALVNVDIDDDEATTPADVPTSLRVRSRSRTGWHTWYFDEDDEIPNIPTDDYGEIRTRWQYVVAPGSFAACCAEEIPDGAAAPGYYTLEDEEPVASIGYDDLPEVFRDVAESVEDVDDSDADHNATSAGNRQASSSGSAAGSSGRSDSAVFDVEAADLASHSDPSKRFTSIFHGSDTGANMSVSDEGKLHCWRHGVAHGGLQALAVLSAKTTYGCRELGKAHKNSGAGRNKLKGDWELIWAAWHEAKQRGKIPSDDPIPYVALRGLAVDEGVLDAEDLVVRDTDTGDVVDDTDAHDGDTYESFPPGAYADALKHVREEHGVDPGREVPDGADGGEEYRTDPRRVEATVDPRRAWEAAGRVTPDELNEPLPVDHTDDGEAWLLDGERVDVVRAAAVAEGLAETASGPITDGYPEAYKLARDRYGAPLPAYYTTADAIAQFDAVLDVVAELTYWDLDADALNSDVTATGDSVDGAAVRSLDPAWRESESGESVLVFDSGNVWDADTERSLAALRFVALDAGVLEGPTDAWDDGEFSTAYQLAREEYGAPLPRWEPAHDGERDHTAQLPDPGDLADARPYDGVDTDALGDARQDVEALLQDAMTDADDPTVVRALPATGKTTGAVKIAAGATDDDRPGIPATYLAPRKELQKQALKKADRWGADADVLPVFSDETVADKVLTAAVSNVREAGKQRLRDRWAVLSTAAEAVDEDLEDLDIFADGDDEDEEAVDLDRPTCETADGDHDDAWALAVHVARRLGYTPREIHTQSRGLFGAPLPCMCDEHGVDVSHLEAEGCRYSLGWSDVADPDDPADLLVGSYVHAHVESARTHYNRGPDGEVVKTPRAVVLDEFIGEAFSREFGAEALDFATWLAASLREDVDDRRDMYEADLAGDGWVTAWLDGDGDEHDGARDVAGALARYGDLLDAREAAAEIRREVDTGLLEGFDLDRPLASLADHDDPVPAFRELAAAVGAVDPKQPGASVARWVEDDVAQPLRRATNDGEAAPSLADVDTDALPFGGDLAQLVEKAVDAVDAGGDGARETVRAAVTALRGGREGCRRLAAWADDGYAHPDAHHLLEAVITPTDADADDPGARRIDTDAWAFDPDATDGTVLDVVDTGDRARALLDRNDHGAILHTPPAREAGNGDPAPLVGLDATARRELWATALLEDVRVEDIHETPAERAAFLEAALDLRVLQASDQPRPYEGDPATKDTDGDVALLEALADEYSGISAPRTRGDAPTTVGKPAAVTAKGVRSVLEDDDRLDDVVAAWEHYGNHTGSNDLGSHRLAALLGCQHYGDDAVERFAALGGESVDTDRRDGRGAELAYGSPLGDAYLEHMQKDQTMQAVLRFARGDSGATVVARTSALREDLPVVGRAQVADTWSDTATTIAGAYRRLGDRFTAADVADTVDVSTRQVRRVLAELVEAGYLRHVGGGDGTAKVYEPGGSPGAGEVDLPDRGAAVANGAAPGRTATNEYYTWNVRVERAGSYLGDLEDGFPAAPRGAPPAPNAETPGPPAG